jgi:hypothetical protein
MDQGILEAARVVRAYLDELLGEDASRLDGEIAALLNSADEAERIDSLRSLLSSDEVIEEWVGEVLDDPLHRPPDYQPVETRDYASPAGLVGLVHAGKYACPHGDFVWYRPSVGTEILPCATHGHCLTLVSE